METYSESRQIAKGQELSLAECEVLEVEAKPQNFLTPSANLEIGSQEPYIAELAGLYMQIKPTSFTVDTSDSSSFFDSQNQLARTKRSSVQPGVIIPCFQTSATGTTTNLEIPAASLVTFDIKFTRKEQAQVLVVQKYITTIKHFKLITIIIICLTL